MRNKPPQPQSTGGIAIVSDVHANIDALGAVLTDRVEFRRVTYDIKKAQARFRKAGLSDFDTKRLGKGN